MILKNDYQKTIDGKTHWKGQRQCRAYQKTIDGRYVTCWKGQCHHRLNHEAPFIFFTDRSGSSSQTYCIDKKCKIRCECHISRRG